jgi:transposase
MEGRTLPGDKKNAERLGAHIVFVDESGFLLIPNVRKTWAPRGETPILRHRYKHDKISVISGLSLSPKSKRPGLYFQYHMENIGNEQVADFLRHLLRHLRGQVIVIWDNGRIHKGEPIRKVCRLFGRLHLEALPPYAPELNPDEGVWNQAKQTLANGRPEDLWDLLDHLLDALCDLSLSPDKLHGCFLQSDLLFF